MRGQRISLDNQFYFYSNDRVMAPKIEWPLFFRGSIWKDFKEEAFKDSWIHPFTKLIENLLCLSNCVKQWDYRLKFYMISHQSRWHKQTKFTIEWDCAMQKASPGQWIENWSRVINDSHLVWIIGWMGNQDKRSRRKRLFRRKRWCTHWMQKQPGDVDYTVDQWIWNSRMRSGMERWTLDVWFLRRICGVRRGTKWGIPGSTDTEWKGRKGVYGRGTNKEGMPGLSGEKKT